MNSKRGARTGRSDGRLRSALPPGRAAVTGALAWALIMAFSAWLSLRALEWQSAASLCDLVAIYAAGGFCAFPVGLFIARLLAGNGRPEARFAAGLLGVAVATVGITSLINALIYCYLYSEWEGDEFSVRLYEFAFTIAVAFYQFAAIGLRLFFPFGFAALIVVSLWFARLRD